MKPPALLAFLISAAACASNPGPAAIHKTSQPAAKFIPTDDAVDSNKHFYDKSGILVIEETDSFPNSDALVDRVTVIASSKENKDKFSLLLKATELKPGTPMGWSPLVVDNEQVVTIDEYVNEIATESARASARAEIEALMKGHEAVVKRAIHVKRGDRP